MLPGAGLEGAVLGILGAEPPRTLNRKQPREAGRKERRLQAGRCEPARNVRCHCLRAMALRLVTHFDVQEDVLPSLLAQGVTSDEGDGAGAGRASWRGRPGLVIRCPIEALGRGGTVPAGTSWGCPSCCKEWYPVRRHREGGGGKGWCRSGTLSRLPPGLS